MSELRIESHGKIYRRIKNSGNIAELYMGEYW
jgi:hypothetical protein